jgi:hypothetical protein
VLLLQVCCVVALSSSMTLSIVLLYMMCKSALLCMVCGALLATFPASLLSPHLAVAQYRAAVVKRLIKVITACVPLLLLSAGMASVWR